jgi:MerR family transcriptional regulator, light-induced transcriptional regulator
MYTIKQAARLTGVPAATLRAWERRYGVVEPSRTESGYRVYDQDAIASLISLRTLIESGWSASNAARAVREGTVAAQPTAAEVAAPPRDRDSGTSAQEAVADFLTAAQDLDSDGLDDSLDRGFAAGSFEFVVEHWLFPALEALGEGWARGEIDVAGEHLASQAVRRRLSAAFDAAGRRARGPSVLVGLPPGSQHELGALVFAVVAKRRGLDVQYLGADVPTASWVAAVQARRPAAAVLAVAMAEDRRAAAATARALRSARSDLLVAAGGAHAVDLRAARTLPASVGAAVDEIDALLHATSP